MGKRSYSKNRSFRVKSFNRTRHMSAQSKSRNYRSALRVTRKNNLKKNTSCRYFALKEYFTSHGLSNANSERNIDKFISKEYDNDSTILDDGVEFPEGKSVIFITRKGDNISDTIHAFLLDNTPDGFYIHSSWGLSSCATMPQWKRYRRELNSINAPYLNMDELDIQQIERYPTVQGPFSEYELRDALDNLRPNLKKIFGLTNREIQFVTYNLDKEHIDIHIFNST